MAVWPWYGTLVKGQLYEAGEFLQVQDYTHVLRWTDRIAQRPAVKRGRKVTRTWGKPSSQLPERHDAGDFATYEGQAGVITLYDCATAPSPRRARILLAEKGIVHETVQVDLRNNEQLDEAFRKINPQCTVPVLRSDDGLLLTDNAASPPGSRRATPSRRCSAPRRRRRPRSRAGTGGSSSRACSPIAEAMRNSAPSLANRALPGPVDYAQIPELAQRGLARVQQFFVTLNARLADREFVATDRFSIADITAVVAVDFARVVKVKADEQHPHLLRWRAAMAQRVSMSL